MSRKTQGFWIKSNVALDHGRFVGFQLRSTLAVQNGQAQQTVGGSLFGAVPSRMPGLSFLQIVELCDNVDLRRDAPDVLYDANYTEDEQLVPFALTDALDSPVVGLLRPAIVKQLALENERSQELGTQQVWKLRLNKDEHRALANGRSIGPCISFQDWVDTPAKRNAVLKEICERWRDTGLFEQVCGPRKWRDELYAIYADPFGTHDHPDQTQGGNTLNFAFEMERSACALFGVITYGVHMSIYEEDVDEKGQKTLRIWIPTRALTKPTYPGYLDNTVAGGIPSGMSPFESIVKECMEEASLPDELVRDRIKATGAVSYFFRTPKGWLQPEVEYVYDIVVPAGADKNLFKPKPLDGEVQSFELMTQDQVIANLKAGKFKTNCGVVLIDLFVRLGFITPENEPDYMKIMTRTHTQFDYSKWKQ